MPEDWLTSDEAASLHGVTAGRVNALARSGELAYRMAGRTRLVDPLAAPTASRSSEVSIPPLFLRLMQRAPNGSRFVVSLSSEEKPVILRLRTGLRTDLRAARTREW